MSNISCDACNNLREYAPNFVQNGVDATVEASLKNNSGLNPAIVVNHTNCEDLNDVNDCLIGRMNDELEAYDVCDWKEFMNKFLSNLYETLKAIIASMCGLWIRVLALCDSVRELLNLIVGSEVAGKAGYYTPVGSAKVVPGYPPANLVPWLEAEVKHAIGCDVSRKMLFVRAGFRYTENTYPYIYGYALQDVQIGDQIAVFSKSAFVPSAFSEALWNSWLRGANLFRLGILNSDTYVFVRCRGHVFVEGVEFNADLAGLYPDGDAVMEIISFIGPSRSGGVTANYLTHSVFNV